MAENTENWTKLESDSRYPRKYEFEELEQVVHDYSSQTVNTIADLRLFNGKDGQIITLLGYYKAGDKPPLNYVYNMERGTDDGGRTINTESGSWVAVFDGSCNIRDFGAKCDNVTDDKTAWINAASFAYDTNFGITLENSDTSYSSEDVNLHRIRKIQIKGQLRLETGKYLIIGSRQAITTPDEIFINQVSGSGLIRVQGSKNAQIRINRATKLDLWADGNDSIISSLAYCKFMLGYVPSIEINGIAGGWVNSNSFYCNRVSNLVIKSEDNSYPHNANTFYNATFENSNIDIQNGSSNLILNARLEGTNSVVFGEKSWGNLIVKQWMSFKSEYLRRASVVTPYVNEGGYNNKIVEWEYLSSNIKDLWEVNLNSNNYSLSNIHKISATQLSNISPGNIFTTGIFEVKESMGFEFLHDANFQNLITRITLYDENMIQLTSEPNDEYAVSGISLIWSSANNRYQNSANPANLSFAIGKSSTYKYARIDIFATSVQVFTYLRARVKFNYSNFYNIPITSETKELSATSIPTSTFYPVNTFVKNKGTDANVLGWSYYGGSWKAVPNIVKSVNTPNITTVDATDLDSALTLVNELKTKLNAKLDADRNSGQQSTT